MPGPPITAFRRAWNLRESVAPGLFAKWHSVIGGGKSACSGQQECPCATALGHNQLASTSRVRKQLLETGLQHIAPRPPALYTGTRMRSSGQNMPVHDVLIDFAKAARQGLGQSGLLQATIYVQGIEQMLQMAAHCFHGAPLLGGDRMLPVTQQKPCPF